MSRQTNAAEVDAGLSSLPHLAIEEVAAQIIADCDGDPRAAVAELVAIIHALIEENKAFAAAASPGYERRRPRAT